MSAYQKRVYGSAMMLLLLGSVYPIMMGISVIRGLLAFGAVMAEDYPKYVIPYTPICVSLLLTAALIPLADKLKKYGFAISVLCSVAVFFALELAMEHIMVFSPLSPVRGTVSIGSWQMYLCVATPEVPVSRITALVGEYSPAFKIHFYLISILMILAVWSTVWGFYRLRPESTHRKRNLLWVQLGAACVFVGLCVLACFTAFFREGTLRVSAISALLMTLFFLIFGMLSGIFLCVLLSDKRRKFVLTLSSTVSAVMTTVMYISELILLDGNLYRFGDGFFFSPMGNFPFAPADLMVILSSGFLTFAVSAALMKKGKTTADGPGDSACDGMEA